MWHELWDSNSFVACITVTRSFQLDTDVMRASTSVTANNDVESMIVSGSQNAFIDKTSTWQIPNEWETWCTYAVVGRYRRWSLPCQIRTQIRVSNVIPTAKEIRNSVDERKLRRMGEETKNCERCSTRRAHEKKWMKGIRKTEDQARIRSSTVLLFLMFSRP